MKKLSAFYLLLLISFNLLSQEIEVNINIANVPKFGSSIDLVLGQFNGDDFKMIEKIPFSGDSTQNFKIKLSGISETGLFNIFIGDKNEKVINKAEIILSKTEKPIISANFYQLKDGSVAIDSSLENQAYTDLLAIRDYYEPQLDELYQKRIILSIFQTDFKRKSNEIELQTEILQSQHNEALTQIIQTYPSTFTSKILVPLTIIPVRSSNVNWATNYDSYFSFLHEHFFDYVDFSNPSILRHYAITEKIKQYFNNFSEASTDGAEKAIDVIMQASNSDASTRSFIYNYLLEIFLKLESEALTNFLIEKYSGDCSLNLPFEELKKLNAIQALSIGGIAPEISLPDSNGDYQSLRAFCSKNEYTILYFWLSWCTRCEKEAPEISRTYQKYKSKKIGVFSVSLDEKKDAWLEKLSEIDKNWINVAELVEIPKSSIVKNYNISTTPLIVILDKQGKVIEKNLFGKDLDTFISTLINK